MKMGLIHQKKREEDGPDWISNHMHTHRYLMWLGCMCMFERGGDISLGMPSYPESW